MANKKIANAKEDVPNDVATILYPILNNPEKGIN